MTIEKKATASKNSAAVVFALMTSVMSKMLADRSYRLRFAIHGSELNGVDRIKVALNGHNDEYLAMWLMMLVFKTIKIDWVFGNDPIKSTVFWGEGTQTPRGMSVVGDRLATISLGCGQLFNEHGARKEKRGTCALLVAMWLTMQKAAGGLPLNIIQIDGLDVAGLLESGADVDDVGRLVIKAIDEGKRVLRPVFAAIEDLFVASVRNDLRGPREGVKDDLSLFQLIIHRHYLSTSPHAVMRWVFAAYDAILRAETLKRQEPKPAPVKESYFFPGDDSLPLQVAALMALQSHGLVGYKTSTILDERAKGGDSWANSVAKRYYDQYQPGYKGGLAKWVLDRIAKAKGREPKRTVERALNLVKRHMASDTSDSQSVLSVKRIDEAMAIAGVPFKDRALWLVRMVRTMININNARRLARREVEEQAKQGNGIKPFSLKGESFRVFCFDSDSPLAMREALNLIPDEERKVERKFRTGATCFDMVVVRNASRGNVAMSISDAFRVKNPRLTEAFFDELTFAVRIMEMQLPPEVLAHMDADTLNKIRKDPEDVPGKPQWFRNDGEGGARGLLNGSWAHPLKAATKLTRQQLVAAIDWAVKQVNATAP